MSTQSLMTSLLASHSTQDTHSSHNSAHSTLSTVPACTPLAILAELQQTDDFQSIVLGKKSDDTSLYYSGVDWLRLPSMKPHDEGICERDAVFWSYGRRIQSSKDNSTWWLCRLCYQRKVPEFIRHIYPINAGSSNPPKHLQKIHKIAATAKKRKLDQAMSSYVSISEYTTSSQSISNYYNEFRPSRFKSLLLSWRVADDHAFRSVESLHLQKLLQYLNPAVDQRGCLPYHSTVKQWALTTYNSCTSVVTEHLCLDGL